MRLARDLHQAVPRELDDELLHGGAVERSRGGVA
jgi:hypothetical protein